MIMLVWKQSKINKYSYELSSLNCDDDLFCKIYRHFDEDFYRVMFSLRSIYAKMMSTPIELTKYNSLAEAKTAVNAFYQDIGCKVLSEELEAFV